MKFDTLIKWRDWTCLATMSRLKIFDAAGTKVAEWGICISEEEYPNQALTTWKRVCCVNTLVATIQSDFDREILDPWFKKVDTKLRNYYCHAGC
jgi:hypothetical protein